MPDRSPQDIVVDRPADGVIRLTLNRPDVRNALRTQTLAEIAAELAAAAADDAIRAVVITGGLRCFAAGADIREMAPLGPVEILTHERQRHWKAIAGFPKPLIAAVNGYRAGRRLRARAVRRHPGRRQQRAVRPARDQPWPDPRRRRRPAGSRAPSARR